MSKLSTVHTPSGMTVSAPAGKMAGGIGINTGSCTECGFCKAMHACALRSANVDTIDFNIDPESGMLTCYNCYAFSGLSYKPTVEKSYVNNGSIFSDELIPADLNYIGLWFDMNPDSFIRFNTHTELSELINLINVFEVCNTRPDRLMSLWTKNTNILKKARAAGYTKPENLIIIQSSLYINVIDDITDPWIDKVFTVFTAVYAIEHNIVINCGARSCNGCMKCYTRNNISYINEMLKDESDLYERLLSEVEIIRANNPGAVIKCACKSTKTNSDRKKSMHAYAA